MSKIPFMHWVVVFCHILRNMRRERSTSGSRSKNCKRSKTHGNLKCALQFVFSCTASTFVICRITYDFQFFFLFLFNLQNDYKHKSTRDDTDECSLISHTLWSLPAACISYSCIKALESIKNILSWLRLEFLVSVKQIDATELKYCSDLQIL